ncbi:MAG: glycosyltransferase family 2 protein [Candidatus Portnoybacteria bacterium]|nr:glycosyltransferase family 2 protein [Candidatus Portnoybacteria bacterium]
MPRVSIIIPTRDRPSLLKRAINSVLAQTFQDFEVIVVDDCPVQNSDYVVRLFNDPRIKYIRHSQHSGGAVARNTGIKSAVGDFIAFLDDDDEWLPTKLQKQVKALDSSGPAVGLVFCGIGLFDASGRLLKTKIHRDEGIVRPFGELLQKCFIWTSSVMMRRELKEKGGYFDVDFKKNQEWDLELRMARLTDFYSIKEMLVKINVLGDGEHMGGKKNLDNIISGFETLIRKHYSEYLKQKRSLALRYFQLADLYFEKGDFKKTRQNLYLSWKNQPLNFIYLKHLAIAFLAKKIYIKIKRHGFFHEI